jgi:hypothetical protein
LLKEIKDRPEVEKYRSDIQERIQELSEKNLGIGQISIRSSPEGAAVYLDGKLQDGITPLILSNVEAGKHALVVLLGLYKAETIVEVKDRETSDLFLELQAPSGKIECISKPSGAVVTMDGQTVGQTPITLSEVVAGTHEITFSLPEYLDKTVGVKVVPKKTVKVSVRLEPEQALNIKEDGDADLLTKIDHYMKLTPVNKLTAEQASAFSAAGIPLDEVNKEAIHHMASRGFTPQQMVQAYQDIMRVNPGYKMDLEAMAVFRAVNLPLDEFINYKESGMTLTDFYNSWLGGRGTKIAGWVVFGVGIGCIGGGLLYYFLGESGSKSSSYDSYNDSSLIDDYEALKIIGYVGMGAGGLMELIAIPMIIYGHSQTAKWAPQGALEEINMHDLEKYKISTVKIFNQSGMDIASQQPTEPRSNLQLMPIITPHFGGVGATWRF